MNCLKCGRETVSEQVFCEKCVQEMEKYPVKPGTAVKLPERRESNSSRRQQKRRTVPLEEQVKILRGRVIRLLIVLLLSFVVIVMMIPSVIEHHFDEHYKVGQNYSVVAATTPQESTDAVIP